ncbi:unnamed protein product [Moneuplotes crassus]|uniref:Uncharacterized protein n=1 Tax=Euplotes crassus TaxID=5936 RepID=A0AAD1UPQ0_EUPCR|nr:unnamed protein product [Moneuplotes crassus]
MESESSDEVEFPPIDDVHAFMMLTPVPMILEELDYTKIFGKTEEAEFLNEGRHEMQLAIKEHFTNIKLCLTSAQTYLDRLSSVEGVLHKKKGTIKWGKMFTSLGKENLKIKIKERSHIKVEIYMVLFSMAIFHKIYAERIICKTTDDDIEETKERIKESCGHIKEAVSIIKFLSLRIPEVFEFPIKDASTLSVMFKDYNKYLLSILDVHFHMIQVEYPFEKKMAYELASKMMSHCALMMEESVKPNLKSFREHYKKPKEIDLAYNYANILHNLCIALKWLARGLNHHKSGEKESCYSAINEAKNIGQKCYDCFEDATSRAENYYFKYIERWLEYIAAVYDYFKGYADNVDYCSMESLYSGPIFEDINLLEKKEKIEPIEIENWPRL